MLTPDEREHLKQLQEQEADFYALVLFLVLVRKPPLHPEAMFDWKAPTLSLLIKEAFADVNTFIEDS